MLSTKEVAENFAKSVMVPTPTTPAQLAAMMKSDSETWTPRIKEMGFQPIEGWLAPLK